MCSAYADLATYVIHLVLLPLFASFSIVMARSANHVSIANGQ